MFLDGLEDVERVTVGLEESKKKNVPISES